MGFNSGFKGLNIPFFHFPYPIALLRNIVCFRQVFDVYFLIIKVPVSIIALASGKVTNRTMNHTYHLLRYDNLCASTVMTTSTYKWSSNRRAV